MDQRLRTARAPAETHPGARDGDRIFRFDAPRLKAICVTALRRQAGNLIALSLMIKKRRLVTLWITTARRAQLTLGVGLLALVLLAPPAASWLSETLYPTRYEQRGPFQRLLDTKTPVPNPLRERRYDEFLIAAWILGFGVTMVVLLGHVPKAIAIGRERAAVLITEADELAVVDPQESTRLRAIAEEYVVDDLMRDVVVAAGNGTATKTQSTQVITGSDRRGASVQYVGGDRRYRIERPLGSGGMGVVHSGVDTLLKRPIALKQLFSHLVADNEQSSRFRQEALALASLTHPHIVTIYDLVEFENHFWIVMELLTGGSLADRIDSRGTIAAAESVEIASDIAGALDYAHQRGIVHRDVKPMNVLFTADGKPKLTDFGNAKLHETAVHTLEGHLLGSPSFMSPEQITGAAIDARTDIYSLGISLYQMLTGRVPFEGELSSILAQHVNRKPDAPSVHVPKISADVDQIVLKMLEKRPEDRFQDCGETIAALHSAAKSLGRLKRA